MHFFHHIRFFKSAAFCLKALAWFINASDWFSMLSSCVHLGVGVVVGVGLPAFLGAGAGTGPLAPHAPVKSRLYVVLHHHLYTLDLGQRRVKFRYFLNIVVPERWCWRGAGRRGGGGGRGSDGGGGTADDGRAGAAGGRAERRAGGAKSPPRCQPPPLSPPYFATRAPNAPLHAPLRLPLAADATEPSIDENACRKLRVGVGVGGWWWPLVCRLPNSLFQRLRGHRGRVIQHRRNHVHQALPRDQVPPTLLGGE